MAYKIEQLPFFGSSVQVGTGRTKVTSLCSLLRFWLFHRDDYDDDHRRRRDAAKRFHSMIMVVFLNVLGSDSLVRLFC